MSGVVRAAPVAAMRSAPSSAARRSGLASMSAHWVGTPWATVTRSSAMIRTASSARHGVGVMTVVMPWAISSQARVM